MKHILTLLLLILLTAEIVAFSLIIPVKADAFFAFTASKYLFTASLTWVSFATTEIEQTNSNNNRVFTCYIYKGKKM